MDNLLFFFEIVATMFSTVLVKRSSSRPVRLGALAMLGWPRSEVFSPALAGLPCSWKLTNFYQSFTVRFRAILNFIKLIHLTFNLTTISDDVLSSAIIWWVASFEDSRTCRTLSANSQGYQPFYAEVWVGLVRYLPPLGAKTGLGSCVVLCQWFGWSRCSGSYGTPLWISDGTRLHASFNFQSQASQCDASLMSEKVGSATRSPVCFDWRLS